MDDEDDLCLMAALFEEPTLGGNAYSIGLESTTGFVLFPTADGSGAHIGSLWRVQVIPAKS
jgi:hypothetical protein